MPRDPSGDRLRSLLTRPAVSEAGDFCVVLDPDIRLDILHVPRCPFQNQRRSGGQAVTGCMGTLFRFHILGGIRSAASLLMYKLSATLANDYSLLLSCDSTSWSATEFPCMSSLPCVLRGTCGRQDYRLISWSRSPRGSAESAPMRLTRLGKVTPLRTSWGHTASTGRSQGILRRFAVKNSSCFGVGCVRRRLRNCSVPRALCFCSISEIISSGRSTRSIYLGRRKATEGVHGRSSSPRQIAAEKVFAAALRDWGVWCASPMQIQGRRFLCLEKGA